MHLPLFIFRGNNHIMAGSSWFMVSDPHDPVITLTRDLMFQYWKDYDELIHYFLVHMFFKMSAEAYRSEWDKVPVISNQPPFHMGDAMYDEYSEERMTYFKSISDFHKMTYKLRPDRVLSPSSIYHYVIENSPRI